MMSWFGKFRSWFAVSLAISIGAISIPMAVDWQKAVLLTIFAIATWVASALFMMIKSVERVEMKALPLISIFAIVEVVVVQQVVYSWLGYGSIFEDEGHAANLFFSSIIGKIFFLPLIPVIGLIHSRKQLTSFIGRINTSTLNWLFGCGLLMIVLSLLASWLNLIPNLIIQDAVLCATFVLVSATFFAVLKIGTAVLTGIL